MSLSLNTGNVVTFDTTDPGLPTDLVVYWSMNLNRLTVCFTLLCGYDTLNQGLATARSTADIVCGTVDIL
jgi:hypothetical protein